MSFTISADDPRTIRAVEIAADADKWLRYGDTDGHHAYGVPSQSDARRRYLVTQWTCDCADFRRAGPPSMASRDAEDRVCKHILAVRLYHELVRAQDRQARAIRVPRRGHLSAVPRTEEAGG